MKIIRYVLGLIFLMVIYLIAWPVSIDPVAWYPPPAPALEGKYALNNYLAAVNIIPVSYTHLTLPTTPYV